MADIINFKRAKKALDRTQAQTAAAENRARFGRTLAEKAKDAAAKAKVEQALDGAKREDNHEI